MDSEVEAPNFCISSNFTLYTRERELVIWVKNGDVTGNKGLPAIGLLTKVKPNGP